MLWLLIHLDSIHVVGERLPIQNSPDELKSALEVRMISLEDHLVKGALVHFVNEMGALGLILIVLKNIQVLTEKPL